MADKALLLGINTYKNVSPLRGCANDVENMRTLLTEVFKFQPSNVKVLLNDKVVKKDVKAQMTWLFKDAKPNDRIVLHYSGHGSQTVDLDDDESDQVDEILCLYDMDFNDPETYLLDDELRAWTKKLPQGVQLTVVLDSCHSGTGTRMMMAPLPGKPSKRVPMLIDAQTTVQRALSGKARTRSGDAVAAALIATNPDDEDTVRARFVEPPPQIKEAIEARRKKKQREFVSADINHILLAGCKDDQTSADATIEHTPNGAFTFYLCKTIRDGGATLERRELIDRIEQALRNAHFTQVPQLEGPTDRGPLFAASKAESGPLNTGQAPIKTKIEAAQAFQADGVNDLKELLPMIALLAPEAQVEAVRLFASRAGLEPRFRFARGAGQRMLVYVHGICRHDAGYSNGWWNALHPFTDAFGSGTLGDMRREVLWSDIVNERALALATARAADPQAAREALERAEVAKEIREALQDRVDRQLMESGPEFAAGEAPRALRDVRGLSIPGLNCVDDFTVYMTNDSVRAEVIGRFTSVVRPLLESGTELDIISHSWGTVVAYEGLRELDDNGQVPGRVRNFFTVGAALSIGPVKMRLRPANRDGRRPATVHRWVNLNARGDVVGGPLKDRPYDVDNDFPSLAPYNCAQLFGRAINPACAHSSYFIAGNDAVNRDIFGALIAQA